MPLPEPPPVVLQLPRWAGIGLYFPPRYTDCSGVRPSWYPFQINVCDVDAPDPPPWTDRMYRLPPPLIPPPAY